MLRAGQQNTVSTPTRQPTALLPLSSDPWTLPSQQQRNVVSVRQQQLSEACKCWVSHYRAQNTKEASGVISKDHGSS